jgi:hypothetical protein
MPTIDRVGPYRIFFFSSDRDEPPHVHVQRDRMLAKFWLQPVFLASSTGFYVHELRRVEAIIEENRDSYLDAWNEHFPT